MVRITAKDKEHQRRIARERVRILFNASIEALKRGEKDLARKYVVLLRKIARKYRIRLGKLKYRFCKACNLPFTPETLRVRVVSAPKWYVVYKCLECGHERRIPYVREVKLKRKSGKKT